MLAFGTLLLGFVLLIVGGGTLVRGASDIAQKCGISPLIIGLTIVGFGTSAPELVVNTLGAIQGATDLAFGNIIGSNISNLALVLGAAAIVAPITIHGQLVKREVPLLLLSASIMTVMALDSFLGNGTAMIGRSDSIILLLLFCIFIYANVMDLFNSRRQDPLFTEINESPFVNVYEPSSYRWLAVIGGCILLFLGGKLAVDGAIDFAAALGVSATVVGLFVVAIGTSLPELVTSIVAAMRKESDLALGNVVGSNLFNSLVVLPISGLISPIGIPSGGIVDLVVLWGLTLVLIPVFILGKARLGRRAGALLLMIYIGYAFARISSDGA